MSRRNKLNHLSRSTRENLRVVNDRRSLNFFSLKVLFKVVNQLRSLKNIDSSKLHSAHLESLNGIVRRILTQWSINQHQNGLIHKLGSFDFWGGLFAGFRDHLVELVIFNQFSNHINASLEFSVDEQLGEGGPAAVELEPLSDPLVI